MSLSLMVKRQEMFGPVFSLVIGQERLGILARSANPSNVRQQVELVIEIGRQADFFQ